MCVAFFGVGVAEATAVISSLIAFLLGTSYMFFSMDAFSRGRKEKVCVAGVEEYW